MNENTKIYLAGHRGLAGSALLRQLEAQGHKNLLTATHAELDLTRQGAVDDFFAAQQPEVVILAAAKVGGILANRDYKADFIRDNLLIQTNVIDAAFRNGVQRLLFLGSSCVYPKHSPQPMKEEHLLSGPLEETNDAYVVAKIAGIKMCQSYNLQHGTNFLSVMPSNLYGPGDNFDLESSHMLPALIRKFHEAKQEGNRPVQLWGTGTPTREALYSDDMAAGCLHLLNHAQAGDVPDDLYNIGTGVELSVAEIAGIIQQVVGHQGEIHWDANKPDGTPRKLQDVSRLADMGWRAPTSLAEGAEKTYRWYLEHEDQFRGA